MDKIYVLDFGSQYSHLIVRRLRELQIFAELVPHNFNLKKLKLAKGIILSGGPQNLSASKALRVNRRVFNLGIPILGICYGLQLMAYELGGRVKSASKQEYGPTEIKILKREHLLNGLKNKELVWMSHGDQVSRLPKGFVVTASSKNCPKVAIANHKKKLYGLQFHPEVTHTPNGAKILKNFIKIAGTKPSWQLESFIKTSISYAKKQIGREHAVCALSGGVDSTVAATLINKAIGKRLHCIYVDTGLMRLNETKEIRQALKKVKLNLKVIRAEKEFLKKLKGVVDPEKKRKIIGELFIRIFEREANKIKPKPKFLVQGTLYTDAITSGVSVGKTAKTIKSHHNVGGLPKKFGFKLIEPLRELYKDEVRKIGELLKLPKNIITRQPFPGPGLAVRIIGEVDKAKLELLKKADWIVREEIEITGFDKKAQQYFAVLPEIKSVGVQGDGRTYGHPIIIRAITTSDFMTADWAKLPAWLLEKISTRITNEVSGINRVVYDITSKPPGTVEWE